MITRSRINNAAFSGHQPSGSAFVNLKPTKNPDDMEGLRGKASNHTHTHTFNVATM